MKTLVVIVAMYNLCAYAVLAKAPEFISMGKMQIIEKMADATTIDVTCSAEGMKTFQQTASIPKKFKSIAEIQKAIEEIKVVIKPSDPTAEICLSADIKDAIGDVLFSAKQCFFLEKQYTEDGMSYNLPSWVGELYFWFAQSSIFFEGVQSAMFIDSQGNEFNLMVDGDFIYVGYHGSGMIKIVDSDGEYWYDWNTGLQVNRSNKTFTSTVQFSDFWKYDGVGDNVILTLYPEFEFVPWVEVTAPKSGIITLNISSYQGYYPSGVWLKGLNDLRMGIDRGSQQYTPGMGIQVNPGETVFLFFDFPNYVWGMELQNGGGKG